MIEKSRLFAWKEDGEQKTIQLVDKMLFLQDQLKGDGTTEVRVKFIRRLEDAIPAGED